MAKKGIERIGRKEFHEVFEGLAQWYKLKPDQRVFPLRHHMQDVLKESVNHAEKTKFTGAAKTAYNKRGKAHWGKAATDEALENFEPEFRKALGVAIPHAMGFHLLKHLAGKLSEEVKTELRSQGIMEGDLIAKPAKMIDKYRELGGPVTKAFSVGVIKSEIEKLFKSEHAVNAFFDSIKKAESELGKGWNDSAGMPIFLKHFTEAMKDHIQVQEVQLPEAMSSAASTAPTAPTEGKVDLDAVKKELNAEWHRATTLEELEKDFGAHPDWKKAVKKHKKAAAVAEPTYDIDALKKELNAEWHRATTLEELEAAFSKHPKWEEAKKKALTAEKIKKPNIGGAGASPDHTPLNEFLRAAGIEEKELEKGIPEDIAEKWTWYLDYNGVTIPKPAKARTKLHEDLDKLTEKIGDLKPFVAKFKEANKGSKIQGGKGQLAKAFNSLAELNGRDFLKLAAVLAKHGIKPKKVHKK